MPFPEPTYLYHLTHVDNLASIIGNSGCLSYNEMQRRGLDHLDIAHQNIQSRRSRKQVPCGPGGVLHDYVPFFFAPRPPMLYAISRGGVECYQGDQTSLIYLVTTAQTIAASDCEWLFTDGHGTMAITDFFDTLEALDMVDWAVMESKYWHDTDADPDRKRRRQAEFLIREICPWRLIQTIGLSNKVIKARVEEILAIADHHPVISIHSDWYY